MFKTLLLICILTYSQAQNCKEDGTILAMKKPTYEFSVGLLDRISYGVTPHFVFSPLSTWLQLIMLAEGAQKDSLDEILDVTGLEGYKKRTCYRRKIKQILNNLKDDSVMRSSAVIIDKLFKLKKHFKTKVESLHKVKVLSLDFDDRENSADKANDALKDNNENLYSLTFLPEDFDKRILLVADLTYFNSAWKQPFNKAQTTPAPFYYYSETGNQIEQRVEMMNEVGYFKESEISSINARVLELPFANERLSMLIFLPTNGNILDIYYSLGNTTLTNVIYSLNKEEAKAVNVSIPKFDIKTEIPNLPELLNNMGMRRAFYPELADLKGITNSGDINISWMSQIAMINVTESHVEAIAVENIIKDAATDFNANKPFAFMLVDKKTELILFAGIYSHPDRKYPIVYRH